MADIELKFLLNPEASRLVHSRMKVICANEAAPRNQTLSSTYFDTEDEVLRRRGLSLRLRRDGRQWTQALRGHIDHHGALSRVTKVESTAPGGRLDLLALPEGDLRHKLLDLVDQSRLLPVCETRFRRTSASVLLADGTVSDLALDVGEVVANDRHAPLRELEIGLRHGNLPALYDLARQLLEDQEVRFSTLAKSRRGYLLASEGRIDTVDSPRTARKVGLTPGMSIEMAAQSILRECLSQIAHSVETVRTSVALEGPHQLRIGLRRLRSALSTFAVAMAGPETDRLNREATWLGQVVGNLRDLDVLRADIVAPVLVRKPYDTSIAALDADLVRKTEKTRAQVRAELTSRRCRQFLLDLSRFIETRGWLVVEDITQTSRLAQLVGGFSEQALTRRWSVVCRMARNLEVMDIEARHDLRKALKKLRYTVEFFQPLYQGQKAAQFLRDLRRLQDVFGALADTAMLQTLLGNGGLLVSGDPAINRAAGYLIGSSEVRAELTWVHAREGWSRLQDKRPYWQ